MIEDRNKTALTKKVTAAAIAYLDERGCKPIETEVPVYNGWVADIAATLNPTITELVNLKLIKRRPKWQASGEKQYRDWYAMAETAQKFRTVLVEVKVSRADFRGDKKWTLPPPVNLAYLAMPHNLLVTPTELPFGWGILRYSTASGCVRLTNPPAVFETSVDQQLDVTLQIAIRRDHDTRYERLRTFQRKIRARENEEISRTRVMKAMRAMQSIVEGQHGSVKDALEYHGIRHMPEYYVRELEKLWAVVVHA